MEFRILGPLEVADEERVLPLGGGKERALLALLLVHAGQVVSTDVLIDDLWNGSPPSTAGKSLQVYISRLRKTLGADAIATRAPGYVLEIDPEQLDATRFAHGVERARDQSPREAAATLRDALSLWRGPALSDLMYEPFARAETARLDELRLVAIEDRIDADLALGNHTPLVSELETLSRSHPYRERLISQHMLALYRSGRQAEALDVYRAARARLTHELGIEPSPALRELERRILSQDPSLTALEAPTLAEATTVRRSRRWRWVVALAGTAAAVVAVVVLVFVPEGDESPVVAKSNSAAFIDPSRNEVAGVVPLGERPTRIAAHRDDLWVLYPDRNAIAHLNRSERQVLGTVGVGGSPSGIVADARGLWVADARTGRVTLIEPERLTVSTTVATRRHPITGPYPAAGQLALGFGSLWVATGNRTITRIDEGTVRVTRRIPNVVTGQTDGGMAIGEGSVWVAGPNQLDPVTRIDPRSNTVLAKIAVAKFRASGVTTGGGSVWVSDVGENNVWRIDPARNVAIATVPVGAAPLGIASGHGSIWVANSGDGTVSRIDASTGRVTHTIHVGGSPNSLAVTPDGVWVTVS